MPSRFVCSGPRWDEWVVLYSSTSRWVCRSVWSLKTLSPFRRPRFVIHALRFFCPRSIVLGGLHETFGATDFSRKVCIFKRISCQCSAIHEHRNPFVNFSLMQPRTVRRKLCSTWHSSSVRCGATLHIPESLVQEIVMILRNLWARSIACLWDQKCWRWRANRCFFESDPVGWGSWLELVTETN